MLKALSEAFAVAISMVAVVDMASAGIAVPEQCWPNCAEDAQCAAWFGPQWYYCGWSNGYTWCCGGE